MRKRLRIIIPTLILLACIALGGPALADAPRHSWHTFDALDGVTATWFYDVAQTPDGALWFATDQGVLRFDGAWQTVNQGLSTTPALALLVDARGQLWVGTAQGLARWQNDGWEIQGKGTDLENERIATLLALPDGSIWAGGRTGVYVWLPDEGWKCLTDIPLPGADHLALDARQSIWLAQGEQLFRYNNGWEAVHLPGPTGIDILSITDLLPDETGGMWVATQVQGIAHVQQNVITWESALSGLPNNHVSALLRAADGRLMAASNGGGVMILDDNGWRSLTTSDGLAADFVSDLYQDKDGVFWFGTAAGVSRYASAIWRTWGDDPHAPHGQITALAVTPDGKAWAGLANRGLFRLQGNDWRQMKFPIGQSQAPLQFIQTLFVDHDGTLWIGTQDNGVIAYADETARQFTIRDGLAENFITAIAQTDDGAMWFGSSSSGLSRWDGKTWRTYTRTDGLISDEITALLAEGQELWVGTRMGLSHYDGAHWQSFTTDDGLSANNITALAQDDKGTLWVGVWGGRITLWQDGAWGQLDAPTGLPATGVEALLFHDGAMWVGDISGLSVYDGRTWQHFSGAYGYDIGRIYVLAGDGAGAIYLGGEEGVTRYRPDHTPPTLAVLAINGEPLQKEVTTILSETPLQIIMAGKDTLSPPSDLRYLYKINGVDRVWRQSRQPIILYPGLAQGDYDLQVQVRDASMNYSAPITLHLHARRSSAFIWLPGLGRIRVEWALLGMMLFTFFTIAVGYGSWYTALHWYKRHQTLARRFNPYIVGSPIRNRKMFYGRNVLLQSAEASLAHNSLMIHGERRIGKTSLLYRLFDDLRQLADRQFRFFPIFIDLEGVLEEEFFHYLMEGLLEGLEEELAGFDLDKKLYYSQVSDSASYSDRHMRRDLRQIIDYLKKQYQRKPRLLFLLDEADVLSTYSSRTQQQLRRILQDTFARHVGVVIAGVHISKAWDRVESPWYNMFVELNLPPLQRDEAEALIREPVRGYYDWDDDAVQFLWQRSRGRPHRIQQIAYEAVTIMLDEQRRRITLTDVRQAYERIAFFETF